MFRPVLSPVHAGMLGALARSVELRRRVIARTVLLPPGRVVSVGERSLIVDHELGQGMMAVSYAVRCRESGQPYALKRARGRFELFRQILAAEAEASRRLPELVGLPTARVVAEDEQSLLKERYDAPTLQALIVDGAVGHAHREALVATLERGKVLLDVHGFHADLSPKNLCWCDDRWVLLDTGEPLVANAFAESVLERISWDAYLAFHGPKIRSRDSQPSALTVAARPDELDLRAASRYAFVREWWLWLPCIDDADPDLLRATFDAAARDDEILFFMEQEGGGWHLRAAARGDPGTVTPELAMERAVDQWRRSFPDRPCSLPAIPLQPRDPMPARAAEPIAEGTRSGAVKVPSRDEQRLESGADPDAVVDKILALLDENRFQTARRMAAEALGRFPEHARVKRCWDIFNNRGKARVAPGGPEPSTHEEFEWLKNPPQWARGKWVALVGSEAVAAADTLAEVLETLSSKKLPKKPLVHRIADGW